MKRRKKHATTLRVAEAYTDKLWRYHHSVSSRSEAASLYVGHSGAVFTLTKVEYYARLPRLLYPHGFCYENLTVHTVFNHTVCVPLVLNRSTDAHHRQHRILPFWPNRQCITISLTSAS
jgi:hypothetical protein